jgi:hypothetical protein
MTHSMICDVGLLYIVYVYVAFSLCFFWRLPSREADKIDIFFKKKSYVPRFPDERKRLIFLGYVPRLYSSVPR